MQVNVWGRVWFAGERRECELAARTLTEVTGDAPLVDLSCQPPGAACCALVFGVSDAPGPMGDALALGRMLATRGVPAAAVLSSGGIADLSLESLISLSDSFRYLVRSPVSGRDLRRLVERLRCTNGPQRAVSTFALANGLSAQETRLLRAAVAGLNNDQAAEVLGCSRTTVTTYWNRIFSKTAQRGQRDVVAAVLRHYSSVR